MGREVGTGEEWERVMGIWLEGGEVQKRAIPGIPVSLGSRIMQGKTGVFATTREHASACSSSTELKELDSGLQASGSLGTVINTFPGKRRLCRLDPLWGLRLIFRGWGHISTVYGPAKTLSHSYSSWPLCLGMRLSRECRHHLRLREPTSPKSLAGLGFPFWGSLAYLSFI